MGSENTCYGSFVYLKICFWVSSLLCSRSLDKTHEIIKFFQSSKSAFEYCNERCFQLNAYVCQRIGRSDLRAKGMLFEKPINWHWPEVYCRVLVAFCSSTELQFMVFERRLRRFKLMSCLPSKSIIFFFWRLQSGYVN